MLKHSKCHILFCLILLMILQGCFSNRTNKHYKYVAEMSFSSFGTVEAKLPGKNIELNNGHLRIHGSPYDLYVFISPKKNQLSQIRLLKIRLMDLETQSTIFQRVGFVEKEIEYIDKHTAVFSFNNIEIEKYNPLLLEVEFQFDEDGVPNTHKTKIFFRKDYKEFKSNILWDNMSSV